MSYDAYHGLWGVSWNRTLGLLRLGVETRMGIAMASQGKAQIRVEGHLGVTDCIGEVCKIDVVVKVPLHAQVSLCNPFHDVYALSKSLDIISWKWDYGHQAGKGRKRGALVARKGAVANDN